MAKQPNVLTITCDELTAGVLSCYGGPVVAPNIDRLAREGAVLTNSICPLPICGPTRVSMFNGLYPHAHGTLNNTSKIVFGPDDQALPKLLHDDGYDCHYYGLGRGKFADDLPYYPDMVRDNPPFSAQLAGLFTRLWEHTQGVRFWQQGQASQTGEENPLPITVAPALRQAREDLGDKWKNEMYGHLLVNMGRLEIPLAKNHDVVVTEKIIEGIDAAGEQPFMLNCNWLCPHDPHCIPSPYYEMYDPQDIALPDNYDSLEGRFERDWARRVVTDLGEPAAREFLRIYYGAVRLVDDQLGRILDALDAKGLAEDTIILFNADHGDMAGGHGMVTKITRAFYDELVRVPLIVRYPRGIQPQRLDIAAGHIDIMPTLLEMAGMNVPGNLHGRSLAPYLTGRADSAEAQKYCFCEWVEWASEIRDGKTRDFADTPRTFMVRGDGWKYCTYADGEQFLYDLNADPGETCNLAGLAEHADRVSELHSRIENWLAQTGYRR